MVSEVLGVEGRNKTKKNMLLGTQTHAGAATVAAAAAAAAAALVASKTGSSGTDFSIAAIMARGGNSSSREPSERSSSKLIGERAVAPKVRLK